MRKEEQDRIEGKMDKEQYRNYIYSRYGSNLKTNTDPTGFLNPDQCYELINERVSNHRSDYSSYNKHYRIKW